MAHDNHTESWAHRELDSLRQEPFWLLTEKWKDPMRIPEVKPYTLDDGRVIHVVRDDLMGFGTKIRAGSAAFFQPEFKKFKTVVYVAPRVGWAPMSLAKLCSETGRRLILFCPAAKRPSEHQLVAKALGAELRFVRIAAMPVLQRWAEQFADRHGYLFFPLGLAVPAAVSGIAKRARAVSDANLGDHHPEEFWTVVSTGVLNRALQAAWPKARAFGVAVARNLKEGEKGRATIYSHPKQFTVAVDHKWMPPFPSVPSYDAKAWEFIVKYASDGAWFWNVAGNLPVQPASVAGSVSDVAWYDESAFADP